jgi:hypothetical protein
MWHALLKLPDAINASCGVLPPPEGLLHPQPHAACSLDDSSQAAAAVQLHGHHRPALDDGHAQVPAVTIQKQACASIHGHATRAGGTLTCWSLSVAYPAELSNGSASFIGGPTVLHACWLHCLLCSCVSWPGISSAATVPLLSAAVTECYWMLNQTAVHMASQ